MGYQLRRWLADRLPASLSSGERLVALEIADLANEKTRLAYGSQLLDTVVHRTGLANQKQVGKVLGRLAANGVELRVPVCNKDGDILRNKAGRIVYAFEGRKLSFRIPEATEFPAREVPRKGDLSEEESTPARETTEEERSPHGETSGPERSPARGQEVPPQGDPVSSSLLKHHPLKAVDTRGTDADAAGGSQQHDEAVAAAAAFLEQLPGQWAVGPVTAKAMAPGLLQSALDRGWELDGDLVTKLTENPGGIRSYPPILRKRIADLPRRNKPQPRNTAPLPDWCGECADGNRTAIREGHLRQVYDDQGHGRPCPKCHPSQTSNAA